MKDSEVIKAPEENEAPKVEPVERGPLISNFGALMAVPDQPAKPATTAGPRPAGNSVEHFQLKQALQRAKQAGVPMRDVAQMVALTYAGK